MIKKIVLLVFFCFYLSSVASQKTPDDYSYVVVPELYNFLHEEDQYQLNSLTKFLFNKSGFNAYFSSELPNVKRCDGLQAEVISNSNFIYTKLVVVLKDCYGVEVFRSDEGKSKYKDYRKSYHQALREAFESVEALNVNQKEVINYQDNTSDKDESEAVEINPQVMGEVVNDSGISVGTGTKLTINSDLNLPEDRYSSYTFDGASFLLRKTDDGYSWYKESETAADGLLLLGKLKLVGNSIVYIDENGHSFSCMFNKNHDLSIVSDGKVQVYKANQ